MAERLVGLDIGTSSVRAVEIINGDGPRPILQAYGQVGLLPGVVADGCVQEVSEVAKAIHHLWHEGGFRERKVRLGVAGLRAITREIDMPPVPLAELDNAVLYEAEQVLPFPVEQTCVSSKVIAQFTDEEGNAQIRVLVAAAHREMIDPMIAAVDEAGLEPTGIDLNTAAIVRALYRNQPLGAPEAIVSIGASLTLVAVHMDGQLQFVRTIDLGSGSVTLAIAGGLDVPFADAERIKRGMGIPGVHDSRADSAAAAAVQELVGEIQSSVRFYSSLPGRGLPSRVLVTGAGSRTYGLLTSLQSNVEVPVTPASPLSVVDSKLQISPDEAAAIDPSLAVAIGLAIPGPTAQQFNLLPKEISAAHTAAKVKSWLKKAALGFVGLVALLTAYQIWQVHQANSSVGTYQAQVQKIVTTEIPKLAPVVKLHTEVTVLQKRDATLVKTEVDWLAVLNELAQYLIPTPALTTTGTTPYLNTVTAKTSVADIETITLSTTTVPGATGPGKSVEKKDHASAIPPPNGLSIIGKGTATLEVTNIPGYKKFYYTMEKAPGIIIGPQTSLVKSHFIVFKMPFTILSNLGSQRANRFDQPLT